MNNTLLANVDQSVISELTKTFDDWNVVQAPGHISIKDLVKQKAVESNSEDPFFVVDLGNIVRQYLLWQKCLPRVKPFYAIKCNNSLAIIQTIAALGGGFDCASSAEIKSVMGLGVGTERIIFANPCKQRSQIKYAKEAGVKRMTFDNEEELRKIKQNFPESEVVLRIITDDSKSICQFSTKFGARLQDCAHLISVAKELDLSLIGVSFHVGSGCMSTDSFVSAIKSARWVFDEAARQGYNMSLLDIGGGYPGTRDVPITFEEIAEGIRPVLDELFPAEVDIIGEPGRYFAAGTYTLACNVFAKRSIQTTDGGSEFLYYINDGVYGSFNCIFFDHAHPEVLTLEDKSEDASMYLSSVFGPTCDALDCIAKRVYLPEMTVGEWVYFPKFGAYTVAAASAFNGFKTNKFFYVYRDFMEEAEGLSSLPIH